MGVLVGRPVAARPRRSLHCSPAMLGAATATTSARKGTCDQQRTGVRHRPTHRSEIDVTHTEQSPEIPARVIDGVECTTRAGIAILAGWKAGNSAAVRAGT